MPIRCLQYVDNDFKLVRMFLAADEVRGPKTHDVIQAAINRVLLRFNIKDDDVSSFVSDGAARTL